MQELVIATIPVARMIISLTRAVSPLASHWIKGDEEDYEHLLCAETLLVVRWGRNKRDKATGMKAEKSDDKAQASSIEGKDSNQMHPRCQWTRHAARKINVKAPAIEMTMDGK